MTLATPKKAMFSLSSARAIFLMSCPYAAAFRTAMTDCPEMSLATARLCRRAERFISAHVRGGDDWLSDMLVYMLS